jgi:hypothetical protein
MRFYLTSVFIVLSVTSFPAIVRGDDKPKPFDPFDDIAPSALKVDVPSLIHVRTDKDAVRVRKELIAFIWKNGGQLPTTSDVVRTDAELPKPLEGCEATCETVTVAMEKGFKSVVYHLRPKKPNKVLVIFHPGQSHLNPLKSS